jgi:hypothetical protein
MVGILLPRAQARQFDGFKTQYCENDEAFDYLARRLRMRYALATVAVDDVPSLPMAHCVFQTVKEGGYDNITIIISTPLQLDNFSVSYWNVLCRCRSSRGRENDFKEFRRRNPSHHNSKDDIELPVLMVGPLFRPPDPR